METNLYLIKLNLIKTNFKNSELFKILATIWDNIVSFFDILTPNLEAFYIYMCHVEHLVRICSEASWPQLCGYVVIPSGTVHRLNAIYCESVQRQNILMNKTHIK